MRIEGAGELSGTLLTKGYGKLMPISSADDTLMMKEYFKMNILD